MLQQANSGQFNPAYHVDFAKFAQAIQNNPDPYSCYPEPLVGLTALEARIAGQLRAMEECTRALEELKGGFGNLKDHLQAQSLQKLEECRKRHRSLSQKLLKVVAAVERYAVLNGAARRNLQMEAQLEGRFARLEESVHAPATARLRLEELQMVLSTLLQRGSPSGGAARLSTAEAEKTLRLTEKQGEVLEMLNEEVARRKRDITQFENAITNFANSNVTAQPI